MPKRPVVSGKEAVKAFERLGFHATRQRGSHVVVRKDTPDGAKGTTVPLHDQIAPGTLAGMLRQAEVDPDEFFKVIR